MRRQHGSTQRWNDVPGSIEVELMQDPDLGVIEPHDEISLTGTPVAARLAGREGWLLIEFESSGYYQEASMYGGADNLGWPADGEDERTVTQAVLFIDRGEDGELQTVITDKAELSQLGELFAKQIAAAELDRMLNDQDD